MTTLNYHSLLHSAESSCDWSDIEDVSASKTHIFGQVLGSGLLVIEMAGTRPNIDMPMTPDPEHWQDLIIDKAALVPELIHSKQ